MFSITVDFSKTDNGVKIRQHLYIKDYPDFMKKPEKSTYESVNVIRKPFREIRKN